MKASIPALIAVALAAGPAFADEALAKAKGCTACHAVHDAAGELVRRKQNDANELCSSCHMTVWAEFQRPHTHRLPQGAMSCVDCHNPHTAGTVSTYTSGLPANTYGIKIYDNINNTTNYVAWDGGRLWHPTAHTNISAQLLCKACHTTVQDHHVHQFNAAALAADVTCVDCHMPDVINVDPTTLRGALRLAFTPSYEASLFAVEIAAGRLREGETFVHESLLGLQFTARAINADVPRADGGPAGVVPAVTARSFLMGTAQWVLHPDDPFRHGLIL